MKKQEVLIWEISVSNLTKKSKKIKNHPVRDVVKELILVLLFLSNV